ncbi:hypothetical protein Tco_1563523 [Tanacetum coccineum]
MHTRASNAELVEPLPEPERTLNLILEYLVKDSKRRAFWSLNEDILKITILKTNTPYPSRKIRRIRACTHQIPQRNEAQYAVSRRCQYAVLKILYSQMYNGKSRHLGVRHSMIRELITNGVISIKFVRSQQNLADHLTKGLAIKSAGC